MTTVDGNIESLSRAILGDAQSEIEDLKSESQAHADAILARARTEAERLRDEILEKARKDARRLKDQAVATAQLKARTLELEHREQLLKKVFDAAAEGLSTVSTRKDFGAAVLKLLREASDQLRSASAIVRADRANTGCAHEGRTRSDLAGGGRRGQAGRSSGARHRGVGSHPGRPPAI